MYYTILKNLSFRIGFDNISQPDLCASFIKTNEFLSIVLTEQSNSIGFPLALKSFLVLHSMLNVQQIKELNFLQILPQRPYEYVETALNIVLLILNHNDPDDIFDRFECERNDRRLLDYMTSEGKRSLRLAIIGSAKLISDLNEIIGNETKFYPTCTVKAYTVLGELNLETLPEDTLIDVIDQRTIGQIDEVNASIVHYAGNHLSKYFGTMSEANVVRTLTKLRELASPDGSDELR